MEESNEERIPRLSEVFKKMENVERLLQEGKIKEKKLPFRARVGKRKVSKGWATVCYMMTNKGVRFLKVPIRDNILEIDGPHLVTPEAIMNYKNKPFIIQPEWSIDPILPGKHYEDTERLKMRAQGIKPINNYLKSSELQTKKKVNMMVVLIILAVVLGGGYYLIKNGGIG